MIDKKVLQKNVEKVINNLKNRGINSDILIKLSNKIDERNKLLKKVSDLQFESNNTTKEISLYDIVPETKEILLEKAKEIKNRIFDEEKKLQEIEEGLDNQLLSIPNILNDKVPYGEGEEDNLLVEEKPNLGRGKIIGVLPHFEIAIKKDIIDFTRAVKLSGSRFSFFKKEGARLVRALENLMLDIHIKNGYTELLPPLLVSSKAMIGTGQLPKFKDDVYKIENEDLFLISTAEIPLTNYYYDEIIDLKNTIKFTSYTPCFRSEAGSSGKDTKGIIRSHQFNKVELVKFTTEENAIKEFESTVKDAENILELLEIPYRKILLCSKDTGFSSSITYDLELWLPSENRYREVSSISYFSDFQARRAKIRYKDLNGKIKFAHTINGSGLAIDRIIACILEIYQNEDGSISIPKKLIPYMNGIEKI